MKRALMLKRLSRTEASWFSSADLAADRGPRLEEDDGSERPFERARDLSGRPGARAPHLVIERQGRRLSMHDLFGTEFVLLTGSNQGTWSAAGGELSRTARFPFKCYSIGVHGDLVEVENRWSDSYGVTNAGAVLVRPDGFVAWRARDASEDAK